MRKIVFTFGLLVIVIMSANAQWSVATMKDVFGKATDEKMLVTPIHGTFSNSVVYKQKFYQGYFYFDKNGSLYAKIFNYANMQPAIIEKRMIFKSDEFKYCSKKNLIDCLRKGTKSIAVYALGDNNEEWLFTLPVVGFTKANKDFFINGDFMVPDDMTEIENDAFSGCIDLTSITMPRSVEIIGDDAFAGCTGLISVSIGDGVISIGDDAFYDCINLTSVLFGKSLETIGESSFSGCKKLSSIEIPEGVTNINDGAFFGAGITSLTLPNSLQNIGINSSDLTHGAFSLCEGLTSVIIPNSVKSIGDYSFMLCSNLTSVIIGNNVKIIGAGSFSRCSKITSISIPTNVTEIGSRAFAFCDSLDTITCYSITPPTLLKDDEGDYDTFKDIPKTCKLYVPASSLDSYRNSVAGGENGWSYFKDKNIVPIQ